MTSDGFGDDYSGPDDGSGMPDADDPLDSSQTSDGLDEAATVPDSSFTTSPLDSPMLGSLPIETSYHPSEDPMEYGYPEQNVFFPPLDTDTGEGSIPGSDDSATWEQQTTDFTCGIMSVRSIVESMTGQSYSEAELTYDATANGWLTRDGMNLDGIANLLESKGVECEIREGGNLDQLVSELQAGHRAVVAVDSGEIWGQDGPFSEFNDGADHAVTLSDVRVNSEGIPVVVVNDSGVPDGAGKEYPLEDFMDAWQDSNFSYVVTR